MGKQIEARIRLREALQDSNMLDLREALSLGAAAGLDDHELSEAAERLAQFSRSLVRDAMHNDEVSSLERAIMDGQANGLKKHELAAAVKRLHELEPPRCAICFSDDVPLTAMQCCGQKSLITSMMKCDACLAHIMAEGSPRCPFCRAKL